MNFINPIEILELQEYSVGKIDNSMIKKAKRKLFAEIDLSDEGTYDYKGVAFTKTDCETVINDLGNLEHAEFYLYLANSNQPLNEFLVNGNEKFFPAFSQDSNRFTSKFVDFVSPYFVLRFDKALLKSFTEFNHIGFNSIVKAKNILKTQSLIASSDINTAFKNLSVEISNRIDQIEKIAREIKNKTTDYTSDNIDDAINLVKELFPANYLNLLPRYFQSQINKIAEAIDTLQLTVWENLYNSSVCVQLSEHLFTLNINSVNKQRYEENYEFFKQRELEVEILKGLKGKFEEEERLKRERVEAEKQKELIRIKLQEEAERRDLERTNVEKREELARKIKEINIRNICLGVMGIFVALVIILMVLSVLSVDKVPGMIPDMKIFIVLTIIFAIGGFKVLMES
jgi:hypothetical protein